MNNYDKKKYKELQTSINLLKSLQKTYLYGGKRYKFIGDITNIIMTLELTKQGFAFLDDKNE